MKISTSAFFDNHVPLAYEPPNSKLITSGNFFNCSSTNLKAKLAICIFELSKDLLGIIDFLTLEIIFFIILPLSPLNQNTMDLVE